MQYLFFRSCPQRCKRRIEIEGSDAGIDRVSSNYAVVAAETTALERLATEIAQQIAARIARYAQAADSQK